MFLLQPCVLSSCPQETCQLIWTSLVSDIWYGCRRTFDLSIFKQKEINYINRDAFIIITSYSDTPSIRGLLQGYLRFVMGLNKACSPVFVYSAWLSGVALVWLGINDPLPLPGSPVAVGAGGLPSGPAAVRSGHWWVPRQWASVFFEHVKKKKEQTMLTNISRLEL